jgi:hypothetical protein
VCLNGNAPDSVDEFGVGDHTSERVAAIIIAFASSAAAFQLVMLDGEPALERFRHLTPRTFLRP